MKAYVESELIAWKAGLFTKKIYLDTSGNIILEIKDTKTGEVSVTAYDVKLTAFFYGTIS